MPKRPDEHKEIAEKGETIGLTPFEHHLLTLALGSSYPLMYAEFGVMYQGLTRGQGKPIPERLFRPRMLKACDKGLLCWTDPSQVWENFKQRKFTITRRGEEALRAWNIASGGDFAYNRYFDGSEDSLDKNMPNKKKVVIDGEKREYSKEDKWREHNERIDRAQMAVQAGSKRPQDLEWAQGKKVE